MAKVPRFKSFRFTQTTSGIAQRLTTDNIITPEFEFYVLSSNSGASMYIGDENVDNTYIPRNRSTIRNFVSEEGDHTCSEQFHLNEIWVDSDATGDIAIVQYKVLE